MKFSNQLKKFVAMALVFAVALAVGTFTLLPQNVEAHDNVVDLSATRFRYPLIRFESALFRKGVELDKNNDAAAYLSVDKKGINGTDEMSLLYARIDDYPDLYDMKLGVNRALRITLSDQTSNAVAESYVAYVGHLGEAVGTNTKILPDDIQGIPTNASDHGIMFHIEFKGLPGKEADGFTHASADANGNITGYKTHAQKEVKIVLQEWDYKANGKVNKKKGKEVATAITTKRSAELTLIWTKDVSFTNDGTLTEQKLNADGSPVKDDAGNYVYGPVDDYSHSAGEVQAWTTYQYNYVGDLSGAGELKLPRDFCGYVIIPFSEMELTWNDSIDGDGMLNLKNLEMANIYIGSYWYHQGEIIIDEFCFWGPTFEKVNGAYDYGNVTFENHKDSMKNRTEIKIEETSKPQEESKPVTPPPAEIQTAVTLKDSTTNVTLNAPASANIAADTELHADVVNLEDDEFIKAVYEKLFGTDASSYKAYMVYLGEDGDIMPEDYCEVVLPVPDGFDADKCKVYTWEGSDLTSAAKVDVTYKLSDDKKSIIVTSMDLGDMIITVADDAAADDTTDDTTDDTNDDTNDTTDDNNDATTDDNTDDTASAPVADDKTETAGADLTWLWIVLGVIVVGGAVAAVLVLTKKKAADEAPAEEAAEETTEE